MKLWIEVDDGLGIKNRFSSPLSSAPESLLELHADSPSTRTQTRAIPCARFSFATFRSFRFEAIAPSYRKIYLFRGRFS
ncbi:MAG: hypothetical protein ABS08_02420 [Actinobacteria bacterium BACL4 MAG-120507-bin0]|nr:MAG: hypothetical protein ABS08_02420 [Actinobacteria bacterium BACL4 MAG-120507-bin0]